MAPREERARPPKEVVETDALVADTAQRERELARAASRISENALATAWDDGDDADHDRL